MTDTLDMLLRIKSLADQRGVFRADAYLFVLEALENVMEAQPARGHISGEELLHGLRDLGKERFGIMAPDVFRAWGVHATLDFGRVVFHLVEDGLLRKRDQDSLRDFIDKFDFDDAFALRALRGEG